MAYRNNVGAATSSVEAELAASHKRARQLLNAIEFQLQQLEQEAMYARPAAATTAGLHARAQDMRLEEETVESRRSALSDSLNRLMAETSEFDRAVNSAFPAIGAGAPGRDIWRRKAQQMQAEAGSIRDTVMNYMRSSYTESRARRERMQREGLFAGTSTTQAVVVDHLLAERSSIASAHTMLDEFTSVADNVLGALRNQRGVLKGAHRKVLDVATRLGVSSSLMRIIERRTVADAVLVYGGMLLILLLIFFAWWFTRSS